MRANIASVVLLLYLGVLIWVLNETSQTRYQVWRNGITVEAETIGFTFDQEGKLGIIGLCYQVNGTTYESQIDGFFSDFKQTESVPILLAADDLEQSYWKTPARFWFREILILTVWSLLLVKLTGSLLPGSKRQRRISDSIIIIGLASLIFVATQPYHQSKKDFIAASQAVTATVESMKKDTCSHINSKNEYQEYPCYKPTYAYTVAQDTFHFEPAKFSGKRPMIGKEQELWYWKQDPSVALNIGAILPTHDYIIIIVVVVFMFCVSLWNLLLRK